MGLMMPRSRQSQAGLAWGTNVSVNGPVVSTALFTTPINTKTAWDQIIAATPYDCQGFIITVSFTSSGAGARGMLLDVGVGAAGSEQVLVGNYPCGGMTSAYANGRFHKYIPVFIPKGTRVAVRVQGNVSTINPNIGMTFFGGGDLQGLPLYAGCEAIGIDLATSFSLNYAAGTINTQTGWTSIGSVTTRDYAAIDPVVQGSSDTTTTDGMYVDAGYGSTWIGPRQMFNSDGNESYSNSAPDLPFPCRVPSGTQMQIRSVSYTTAGNIFGIALLAYY